MTCLLIDDDLDDQEIFTLALREVNPEIECMLAQDGREGLEKLRLLEGHPHDFIFVDLNMPRLNGVETLEHIKKMPSLANSKVIIYSTTSNQKVINDARARGANEFLVKPPSIRELVGELRKILQKYS